MIERSTEGGPGPGRRVGVSAGAPAAGQIRVCSGAAAPVLRTLTSTTAGEVIGVDPLSVGDVTGDGPADPVGSGHGGELPPPAGNGSAAGRP